MRIEIVQIIDKLCIRNDICCISYRWLKKSKKIYFCHIWILGKKHTLLLYFSWLFLPWWLNELTNSKSGEKYLVKDQFVTWCHTVSLRPGAEHGLFELAQLTGQVSEPRRGCYFGVQGMNIEINFEVEARRWWVRPIKAADKWGSSRKGVGTCRGVPYFYYGARKTIPQCARPDALFPFYFHNDRAPDGLNMAAVWGQKED